MKKHKMILSDLICSDCGISITIPRRLSIQREKYHIKDLYCVKCNKVTKYIEVRNLDILKKELEYKKNLNNTEKLIYKLTNKESK